MPPAPEIMSPKAAAAQQATAGGNQTERVIRDPGPRIVNRDQYEEITHKAKKKEAKNNEALVMAEGNQVVDKIAKKKE